MMCSYKKNNEETSTREKNILKIAIEDRNLKT